MTEQTTPQVTTINGEQIITVNGLPLPSRGTRRKLVIGTLVLCWVAIGYIIVMGNPQNSLHTSALAWAFGTQVATLFSYVFGAVMDNWNVMKNVK